MRIPVILALTVVTLLASASCMRNRRYELRGQLLAVDATKLVLTIKHEDIPGFMPAMTMTFAVRDRRLLQGREPGELITATLIVDDNAPYLTEVRRTGFAPLADMPTSAPVEVLAAGDPIPDATFIDQGGRTRRLSDWRGRVIAVTFIYTRCPLPNFCPLMDRHFREVQREIIQDPALRERVRLLSVSFDPGYDTPKILAAHAARVSADPAYWTMLTGEREAVGRFASKFGVSIIREGDSAEIVHNLRTAIIDSQGRVVTMLSGNEWLPSELLGHLRTAR